MKIARIVLLLSLLSLLSLTSTLSANPVDVRDRVEREFRQLETALTRFMNNTLPQASNMDAMSRALYEFMRENPGVARILRTNAAGITVNDMSAGASRSEPPRDIANQRWHQYVTQYKMPYYSMDYNTDGQLTLFYAWPMMGGPDRSRFSGAFAAVIDFTAHAALIDDAQPFQIAYRGRAFFQHEWDEVDFDEEPLDIRGTKELTIRTERPVPTRADPAEPSLRRLPPSAEGGGGVGDDIVDIVDDGSRSDVAVNNNDKRVSRRGAAEFFSVTNILLIAAIVGLLAYLIFKPRRGSGKFVMYEVPLVQEEGDRVIVSTMSAPPPIPAAPYQPIPPIPSMPSPPPTQPAPPPSIPSIAETPNIPSAPPPEASMVDIDNSYVDQQMNKLLTKVKQEFVRMDKMITALALRISALEKRG